MSQRVHISTDHAAFELKQYLVQQLVDAGYEVIDHGADTYEALDDYPDFIIPCAEAVLADRGSLGIVLGGSGNGEQMAANKVPGIRAALAYTVETATLARQHNDAHCIAMGGRMQSQELAWEMVQAFLTTPFSGDERHQRRLDKVAAYEASHTD